MKDLRLEKLSAEVVAALSNSKLVIATAESCTGGWLSKAITDVAGSSIVFDRGFVTYSNQSKIDMLGVDPDILEQFGAVSEETTQQMAAGAILNSKANVAISTSGIAGPGGGSRDKPVGTICFGWQLQSGTSSETKYLTGNRDTIRYQSCCYALESLLAQLD